MGHLAGLNGEVLCYMRIGFYIDGFNAYGAFVDECDRCREAGLPEPHYLKWVDYRGIADYLLRSLEQNQGIQGSVQHIKFYTTLPPAEYTKETVPKLLNGPRISRHRNFVDASVARGLLIHYGAFKDVPTTCPSCAHRYRKRVEKETDVHLAVDIVRDALRGDVDVAVVMSGDSDLGPAFQTVRADTDVQLVSVVFQPRQASKNLVRFSHAQYRLSLGIVAQHLLPATVVKADGSTVLRPKEYHPPQ